MTRFVVAHASAHGSTQGVAARIADVLRADGHPVALHAITDSVSEGIDGADVLVVGSAIHNGQWLPGAEEFAEKLTNLTSTKVWTFSVSSVGMTTSFLSTAVARRLRPHLREPRAVADLRARADVRSHRFFAGAIAPGDWPGVGRILFRLMGGRYGDARDWSDIDHWAQQIIAETNAPT